MKSNKLIASLLVSTVFMLGAVLASLSVAQAQTLPCSVTITSPATNSTISGTVLISVTTSCAPGTPSTFYRLYVGGKNFQFSGASYELDTTTMPNGPSGLVVIAWDSTGLVKEGVSPSVPITIANGVPTPTPTAVPTPTPNGLPCTVTITSPAINSIVSGIVPVSITNSCQAGTPGVFDRVYVAGTTFQVSGGTYNWDTRTIPNGIQGMTAIAWNNSTGTIKEGVSSSTTITVSNVVGTPTFTPKPSPTLRPTASATAKPTASPTPTALPTLAPTRPPTTAPTSTPTLAATRAPTIAPTGAPTVAPTPGANGLPCTVTITSPASNSTISGTVPVFITNLCQPGTPGVFDRVYVSSTTFDFATNPYSWDTTTIPDGTYGMVAIAWDPTGLIKEGVSANVTITIANGGVTTPTPGGSGSSVPTPTQTPAPVAKASVTGNFAATLATGYKEVFGGVGLPFTSTQTQMSGIM
ncbi:MAG TPA: hypothetical protein VGY99_14675 [Candidatus Binataceae bacterium]|jgi:hypothetical protein|nr:hypothetical protein [Candidatus Binataceae bacterium]